MARRPSPRSSTPRPDRTRKQGGPKPSPRGPGRPSSGPRRSADPRAARPFETFEATFLGHPEGTGGFLRPLGAAKGQGLDLLVDWRDASGAIHGDRV